MRRKRLYLAWLTCHFLVILSVCCRDTFSVLARGRTVFPLSFRDFWQQAETITSAALGEDLAVSNPARQALAVYMNSAGIEAGYGFFAPNIPNNYKLVFEIHYPDDRVEYELPQVSGAATGLRMATLLDYIGQTRYAPLRELLLKMLAYSTWQAHPNAMMIRAVLGFVTLPSAADFQRGQKESYEFLYAYDFRFHEEPTQRQRP